MAHMVHLLHVALTMAVGALLAAQAFAWWVMAPFPYEPLLSIRTTARLALAPKAERIVIGDSRVEWARPTGEALFIGYGSATLVHLERLTRTLCALSDAPVTIALGVNDAKPEEFDLAASLASAERMVEACKDDGVVLAGIWPVEPEVAPAGHLYDPAAIAALDEGLNAIGRREQIPVLAAPELTGHTIDGVHFTEAVAADYLHALAQAARRP